MAQVKLPQIVRDSMILQRDTKINIWGWAAAGEKVTVSFNGTSVKTKTDTDSKWKIVLPPMKAGGPYTMTVSGKNKIALKDILIGDVWFCSGQSNMVHQLNIHDVSYEKDIADANYPQIRQFWVPNVADLQQPRQDIEPGNWQAAVGEDVRPFSVVAYFFAKKIFEKYHIPIGIINCSVGGPPVESWISEEGLKDFPAILNTIQKNKDTSYVNSLLRNSNWSQVQPTDKGLTDPLPWYDVRYIPKGWKRIAVPGYWEDQGIKDLNGVVWYRKEINVPASMVGKPARFFLGRMVDADVVYLNGKQVGNTTYQYPQRRYRITPGILKEGKNIIVIKITNTASRGGFVPDKPYCLFAGNDTIDLTGYWQYKVGAVFPPIKFTGESFNFLYQPVGLYNAMVAPLVNYTIKGFLWYQGEGNISSPAEYAKLQPAQINDWRSKWNQGDLPFLFVQLPNFGDANYLPSESSWAVLRESQLKSLSVPNTGMAVAIDLGEWNDIHPDDKKDIGERLSLIALNKVYGESNVYSGPIFQSATVDGNKIMLSFTNTGGGLISKDGEELREFAIAGADKKFVWAKAIIDGDKIIVSNEAVVNPLYVRYAWADNPDVNFYNKQGLPASPFRTDE